jgi:hypothetical protein
MPKTWQRRGVVATIRYGKCEVKGGFFKCGDAASAVCVYCGRHFCEKHGVVRDLGEEICDSKNCVAKREDLDRHFVYKGTVQVFNRQQICGLEVCVDEWEVQCSRCRGYFCKTHIQAREMMVNDEGVQAMRLVLVCGHCWGRRPIWDKV